jgi:hypothetical protein
MKKLFLLQSLLAVAIAVCLAGCNDSDDGSSSPVGPSIAGTWSGVYRVEGGNSIAITASVSQDGDAVGIATSKPGPPGRRLTGTITPEGEMTMTDADDGEIWSTFGAVTETHIRIGDFIRQPTARDRDVPLKIIELER